MDQIIKKMEILARGVGRRKEAVAQVQILKGTGLFLINQIPAQQYLHNNTCTLLSVKAPFDVLNGSKQHETGTTSEVTETLVGTTAKTEENFKIENYNSTGYSIENLNTIVKVKGGGLVGQAEAIKLGLARALCDLKFEGGVGSSLEIQASLRASNNIQTVSQGIETIGSNIEPNLVPTVNSIENTQMSRMNLKTEDIRKQLKDKGFLTQDSRVKERRKYGLKKARKATQYNKR